MSKTALVTGAGSGLGSSIARILAGAGYDVAIHSGSNAHRAQMLSQELAAESGRHIEVILSDFSKPRGAQRLFEQFRLKFDSLDLFVNNAGITMGAPIFEMSEKAFDLVNNVNWKSAYFCVQQAAKLMAETNTHGHIVIISSNCHTTTWQDASVYATTKEALVKLSRHAALEFAPLGIRVNCIAPGWVDTGEKRMDGCKEKYIPRIPLKRWVQPVEIGEWILFLTGSAGASLTGDTVELDGGVRLMSGQ